MIGMNEDGSESGAAGSYYSNLVTVNARPPFISNLRLLGRCMLGCMVAEYGILLCLILIGLLLRDVLLRFINV